VIPSRRGNAERFVIAMLLMEGVLASSWCAYAGDSATANSPAKGVDGQAQQVLTTLDSLNREVIGDAKYLLSSPLRLDKQSALLLGGVAAGIGGLMLVDSDIQKSFQENRTNTNDDIADSLETFGFPTNFLIGHAGLIGAGWWFREHKEGDKLFRTALVSLEAQLFAEGIIGLTKFAVGRDRPSTGQGEQSFDPFLAFDKSFPSSHAGRAFAVAAVFADRYEQPVPLLLYTTATFIGLSRIYLNDHFASDVFAGAALGFAVGKALSWRHKDDDRRLTFLPLAPQLGSGVGVTVQYSFR
jgi:membrane-associated phospholipid phosphatase